MNFRRFILDNMIINISKEALTFPFFSSVRENTPPCIITKKHIYPKSFQLEKVEIFLLLFFPRFTQVSNPRVTLMLICTQPPECKKNPSILQTFKSLWLSSQKSSPACFQFVTTNPSFEKKTSQM